MARIIAVVVVLGLAGFSATDVDCPDQPEAIEAVEVVLALPLTLRASVPKPPAARWQPAARDTGLELSTSIFRPPISA